MLRSRVCIGGVVALLVIVGAACGGDDDDDSNASAVTTTSTTTAGSDSGSSEEFDAYVGLTVEEATAKAEDEGRPARVVEEDGESLPVTMDFNPDRLNFTVVDGKVTEVSTG
jgi:hypothetical protein